MNELLNRMANFEADGFVLMFDREPKELAQIFGNVELLGYLPGTNSKVVACKKVIVKTVH